MTDTKETIGVYISKDGMKYINLNKAKLPHMDMSPPLNHHLNDLRILYFKHSRSSFKNEITSTILGSKIKGNSIFFIRKTKLEKNQIESLYNKIKSKPKWSDLARNISEEDSKKLFEEFKEKRLKDELENKNNEDDVETDLDDLYDEYDEDVHYFDYTDYL